MQNNITDDNQTMSASSSAVQVSELRELSGSPTKRLYSSAPDIMMTTTPNENTIADQEKIEIQTPSELTDGQIFGENNTGTINSQDEKNRGDLAGRPWCSMPNLSNNDVALKLDGEKKIECIAAPMQVPCNSSACTATAEPAVVEIETRSVLTNRQIFDEQNPGPINYYDGKNRGDLAGRPWRSMPNLSNHYVVMKSDEEKKIESIATPMQVPCNSLACTATSEPAVVEIETRSALSKRQIFVEQNPGPINYHDGKNHGDLADRPWRSMPNLSNYYVTMKDDVPKIECIATPTQVPCDSSGVVPAKRRSLWKRTKRFVRRMFCCDYSQKCPDCHKCFYSATSLLVHFFSHVGEEKLVKADNNENSSISKKKPVETSNYASSKPLNLTVGETFNPWKYCLATYEENNDEPVKSFKKVTKKNKEKDKTFECSLCNKKFGWTTDLKRHLLIHTGERPFKCNSCQAAFTRNFLLQKHFARAHKKISEDESKKLENHVHANVTEIKLKMKELERQQERKSASDNDSQ